MKLRISVLAAALRAGAEYVDFEYENFLSIVLVVVFSVFFVGGLGIDKAVTGSYKSKFFSNSYH